MARAGFCQTCGANVWLRSDGSCAVGHSPSVISNVYHAELTAPMCPYCCIGLHKVPTRKTTCPHCNHHVYVRTSPMTNQKCLLTEAEAGKIDLVKQLAWCGVTDAHVERSYRRLADKWGHDPAVSDLAWSLINEFAIKAAQMGDLHAAKQLYHQMAIQVNKEGKDPYPYLQESAKMEILHYQQTQEWGPVGVKVLAGQCAECQKLNGKEYSFEAALRDMPIPNSNCTSHVHKGKFHFCRCSYTAAFPG